MLNAEALRVIADNLGAARGNVIVAADLIDDVIASMKDGSVGVTLELDDKHVVELEKLAGLLVGSREAVRALARHVEAGVPPATVS